MKVTKTEVFMVDYGDLDEFLTQYYGHEYSYLAAEECRNYSLSREVVEGKEIDNAWAQGKIDRFLEGGKLSGGLTNLLLNDLCVKGEIEPGEYIVDIFW